MQSISSMKLGSPTRNLQRAFQEKLKTSPVGQQRSRTKLQCRAGVKVEFHMPYRANLGDHLAVVGAGEHLGDWQVSKSFALNWTEGDEWVGTLEVPAGSTLEYKYIVARCDGSTEWSPGNNYMLEVVDSEGAVMALYEGWVKDGPRHVNITEPHGHRSPRGAGHAKAQNPKLQSSTAKLNSATERLQRVEIENAIQNLLLQHPEMSADQLHVTLPALIPRRGEFSYEAMETLLTTMVHEDKLIVTAGHYSLHPDNRILHSDSSADEFAEGDEEEDGFLPSPRDSPMRRAAPPAPARFQSPTSPAATPSPVSSARSARTDGAGHSLAPAVMKLLEVYSGMTLDRLHRVLGNAVADYSATQSELKAVMAQLQQQGRVIEQDGMYRKGMATPSPSRRAPPQPTRAPRSHSASPSPSQASSRLSAGSRSGSDSRSPASPAAASPARGGSFSAYEQRALSLLSNYSGCTAERLYGQLTATTDFPGSVSDLDDMLRTLAVEGRVKDENGIYRYVSTRSATPTAARGMTTTPTRVPGGATRRSNSAESASPAARSPAAASYEDVPIDHLAGYEQRVTSVLANYSGCTVERLYGQLKAVMDFPGTQQELGAMLRKLVEGGRVKDANGIYSYVSQRSNSPTATRSKSPTGARTATPTPARPATPTASRTPTPSPTRYSLGMNGAGASLRGRSGAAGGSGPALSIDHLAAYEQRLLSILSNYSGCTLERLYGQLQATIDFPGTEEELGAMLDKLSVEGRVKDDDGVYRYVSTRSATPRAARGGAPTAARAPSPMPSNRIGSPLPSRGSNRVGGSMPVPGSPAHRTNPNTPGNNGSNGSRASASINPVAYSLFCEEFRGAMKAKYPGASPQDLAQILAAEWQAVLPSTRARYERMASHERMPSPSGSRG